MSKQFDVIVIGAGPGGYIAAIRAAQLGMSVACIDEWKNASGGPAPGGTCTNVGCIPSKALLQSSEHFEQANHHFAEHGISATGVKMDVAKMLARKDTVVKQNNDGILYLFKKNKVTFFHGRGAFASKSEAGYEIKVSGKAEESLTAKENIQPVAKVELAQISSEGSGSGGKSGEEVYKAVCSMCHQAGMLNAPKFGDAQAWTPRITQGYETLVQHALKGIRSMPAKGGNASLSDNEVAGAVLYMTNSSGANFKK